MRKVKIIAIGMISVLLFAGTVTVSACDTPFEGFTPGYWKNHLDDWVGYSPGDIVEDVFIVDGITFPRWTPPGLIDKTLLEALDFNGGPLFRGAVKILLRVGTAALLNAAHPDVDYRYTERAVIVRVLSAVWTRSRAAVLVIAMDLDHWNNHGGEI